MALQVQRKGFVSEINVVPFVDVMLVLLVIFMVTAPLMTQGVDIDLPQTKTVETLPEDSDHLMLTVKRDGGIFLDEYEVKREDLGRQLKRLVTDEGKLLYLRADREASYGLVVEIMAEAKEAGISRLGVVAEPEEE